MKYRTLSIQILKLLKPCVIPYVICTLFFLLNPSLNLSKIITAYQDQSRIEYLKEVVFTFSFKGYLLSLLVITLGCFLFKRYGVIIFARCIVCTLVIFMMLSSVTEFPTLGQLGLVWSKNQIWLHGDIERYKLLLTCLIGWIISFMLDIIILHMYYKVYQNEDENV